MPHFLFSPVFFAPLLISLNVKFSHFPCSLSLTKFLSPRFSFRLAEREEKAGKMVRYRQKANRDRIEKSRQRDWRRKWGKAGVTRK
jgi:hypothetical protein